jgi:hypothetical protein
MLGTVLSKLESPQQTHLVIPAHAGTWAFNRLAQFQLNENHSSLRALRGEMDCARRTQSGGGLAYGKNLTQTKSR